MAGRRHHYLPAAAIGRFSTELGIAHTRNRHVWVRRVNGTTCLQRASSVAFENNLYDIGDVRIWDPPTGDRNAIDDYWIAREQSIWPGLDVMLAGGTGLYDVHAWAQVVGYIASLFARSPDFHHNFRKRFKGWDSAFLDEHVSYEHTNALRVVENQRVMAAVLRARWDVLICDESPLILNDRGMTAMWNPYANASGYVFPLLPGIAMALSQGPHPKHAMWLGDSWRIDIPTQYLHLPQARSLNRATWRQCRREVYSGDRAELDVLPDLTDQERRGPDEDEFDHAQLLGLTRHQRMASEYPGLMLIMHGLPRPADTRNAPVISI